MIPDFPSFFYDIARNVALGSYLVIEISPVEGRLKHGRIEHSEVLLNVQLHLGGRRSRKGYERRLTYVVHYGTYAAVFRTEVVPPFRDTVRLIDGVERYLYLAQERYVVLFGKRLRSEIKQLGLPCQHILLDGRYRGLVER